MPDFKFDVGDTVWTMRNDRVRELKVYARFEVMGSGTSTDQTYVVDTPDNIRITRNKNTDYTRMNDCVGKGVKASVLFASAEALRDHLFSELAVETPIEENVGKTVAQAAAEAAKPSIGGGTITAKPRPDPFPFVNPVPAPVYPKKQQGQYDGQPLGPHYFLKHAPTTTPHKNPFGGDSILTLDPTPDELKNFPPK